MYTDIFIKKIQYLHLDSSKRCTFFRNLKNTMRKLRVMFKRENIYLQYRQHIIKIYKPNITYNVY